MRKTGEIHTVLDNNGEPILSQYPQTREEALIQDIVFYEPRPRPLCEVCNSYFLVYTKTNMPNCCAMRESVHEFRYARNNGEPLSGEDAIARGLDYYWKSSFNKDCGHSGKMTLKGKCYQCEHDKVNQSPSPRQIALSKGEQWYMPLPNDPCKNGHVALRYVATGTCKQCQDEKRTTVDTVQINKISPDMIITRKDAKLAGFKVYRTGRLCSGGHTGWRYVTTGNCLDCR